MLNDVIQRLLEYVISCLTLSLPLQISGEYQSFKSALEKGENIFSWSFQLVFYNDCFYC